MAGRLPSLSEDSGSLVSVYCALLRLLSHFGSAAVPVEVLSERCLAGPMSLPAPTAGSSSVSASGDWSG